MRHLPKLPHCPTAVSVNILLLVSFAYLSSAVFAQSQALVTSTTQQPKKICVDDYGETIWNYEAEDARFMGDIYAANQLPGHTGKGYVTGFERDDDAVEFAICVPTEGFYDLNFVTAVDSGERKNNFVYIDGEQVGSVNAKSTNFSDSILQRTFLSAGQHNVTYSTHWGWVSLDRLQIRPAPNLDQKIFEVPATLVNPNATPGTRQLMDFLVQTYGHYIITGQHTTRGVNGLEFSAIRSMTRRNPAVIGLDLIDYNPSWITRGTHRGAVEQAITFHQQGGIVMIYWHWVPPEEYLTGTWYRGFYADETNIDLEKILNGEDERGRALLMRDIDTIAIQLLRLQDAGVPVLWRPLHEASGKWFWWGSAGPEAQIKLWRIIYHRLTCYHGLNNLIWLWNGEDADWYPGDDYVDIIGEDIYADEDAHGSQIGRFLQAQSYTATPKIVVLSENGAFFDPDLAVRDGAMWGFFAAWSETPSPKDSHLRYYPETYLQRHMIQHVYAHEQTLTLEDLPEHL